MNDPNELTATLAAIARAAAGMCDHGTTRYCYECDDEANDFEPEAWTNPQTGEVET